MCTNICFPSLYGVNLEQKVTVMHPFPRSWNYLNVKLSYLNDEGDPFLVILLQSIVPEKEDEEQDTIVKATRQFNDQY